MVLFIMLCKVVLIVESVNKLLGVVVKMEAIEQH